jgi:pimeloyl-ACP methyl ester carboxylesterase
MHAATHARPPEYRFAGYRLAAALLLLPVALAAQQAKLVLPPEPSAFKTSTLTTTPSTRPPLIVVGFAGGFIKRTSMVHGEVELARRLREKYGSSIHADIFENHNGDEAHREILRLIDASSPSAKKYPPRIILYGHSWGASEAVEVARKLERDGVPVLLLVEVDGVPKGHRDDSVIPANVAQAINFYQTEGLLHGRPAIHAANPATTQIVDNIHLSYKDDDVACPGYPWFARVFTKRHIQIENDPRVWNQVEAMILANLPATAPTPN